MTIRTANAGAAGVSGRLVFSAGSSEGWQQWRTCFWALAWRLAAVAAW